MNPNWFGTICAGGALMVFLPSYRLGMSLTTRTRTLLALVSIMLALPGASFAGYYAHLLPEPSWYYEFRSWHGTECLLIALGVAGGLLASLLPRMLLILPFLGVVAFAFTPVLKPFIGPIPAGAITNKWNGEICLQSTPSTCGAASVATILRAYGMVVTESQLAHDAHSYVGGTEAWYLARAVRDRGCDTSFRFSAGFDPDIPLPAVVGVRLGAIGHFIAVLSRDGNRFRIGDPLIGPEILSREQLLNRYTFSGFNMPVSRGIRVAPAAAACGFPAEIMAPIMNPPAPKKNPNKIEIGEG